MKLVTANIKDNPDMPDAHVRSDIREIYRWRRGWSVAGWQEIGEAADHRAIREIWSRGRGFTEYFPRRQTPISVRTIAWSVTENYWRKTHDGGQGITPTRGYSVVILKSRLRPWVKPVAVINTHFISGAWYGNKSHQSWRRQKWNEHYAELSTHIRLLNGRGITVIVMGDWNRRKGDIKKITSNSFWAATNWYYDHIMVCPASNGAKVRVDKKLVYGGNLYTDHKPVMVKVYLS